MTINSSFSSYLLSPPSLRTMSTFETPVAAEKPPSVSPVATLAGKRILGAGFDPEILDIMVTLLAGLT